MSLSRDLDQYFQVIHKELGIPIAVLEERYRANLAEPSSRIESLAASANATALFKEMKILGIISSPDQENGEVISPSALMGYYAVYRLIRSKREEVQIENGAKPGELTIDQYMDVQNAYNEVVSARESGTGGKHALLAAALGRVGVQVMSWQESQAVAQDLLSRGFSPH